MSTKRNPIQPDADPHNADWPKFRHRKIAEMIDDNCRLQELLWEVLPQLEGWANFLEEDAPNEGDHESLQDLITRIKAALGVTA